MQGLLDGLRVLEDLVDLLEGSTLNAKANTGLANE